MDMDVNQKKKTGENGLDRSEFMVIQLIAQPATRTYYSLSLPSISPDQPTTAAARVQLGELDDDHIQQPL